MFVSSQGRAESFIWFITHLAAKVHAHTFFFFFRLPVKPTILYGHMNNITNPLQAIRTSGGLSDPFFLLGHSVDIFVDQLIITLFAMEFFSPPRFNQERTHLDVGKIALLCKVTSLLIFTV